MKKIFTLLLQPKIYVLTFVLSVSILAGCKKEIAGYEVLASTPVPVNYLDHVKFTGTRNMLVFENINVLKQVIADNAATNGNTFTAMNARFPAFVSMANIYTQFDKKEADLIERLDDSALSSTNVDWTKYLKMGDIGKSYSHMILVKQYPDNQEYYYDMNIGQKQYADLVNTDGLLAVNDTIYQFTENRVKLITDGDYAKITMLANINVSSPIDHILVIPNNDFMLGWYQSGTTQLPPTVCVDSWDQTKMTPSGSGVDERRLEINVRFEQYPVYAYNRSSCSVTFISAKKKQLIISRGKISHIWVDAYPRACNLSGGFTASRLPAASAFHTPSGFNAKLGKGLENPVSALIPMSLRTPFVHYIDYSSPYQDCYKMTAGSYKLEADFRIFRRDVIYSW